MRIARVEIDGAATYVRIEGPEAWPLPGVPFGGVGSSSGPGGPSRTLAELKLLAPVAPSKILAVARNYRAHAAELGQVAPEEEPLFFLKAPSALLPPGGTIVIPRLPVGRERVDYEGELAVVIGRRAKDVPLERAAEHIFGYTCLLDVTARQVQKAQAHFTQSKGYDTFCPIGPWIETELDPRDLWVRTTVNGVRVQDGRTSEMVHPVLRLVAHLSSVMTLEPGDVIATGTPQGVGPLHPGDQVEVEIQGIGALRVSVGVSGRE